MGTEQLFASAPAVTGDDRPPKARTDVLGNRLSPEAYAGRRGSVNRGGKAGLVTMRLGRPNRELLELIAYDEGLTLTGVAIRALHCYATQQGYNVESKGEATAA